MDELKTLDSIIGERVKVYVESYHAPFSILGDRSVRYGTMPVDTYRIIWEYYYLDDETDEDGYETIAIAEIRTASFDNFEQAKDYMDECSQETYDWTICAEAYYNKYPKRCKVIRESNRSFDELNLIDLHTFYISPKYRRKGIGKIIMLQLPELFTELGLGYGLIYAYVNPFVNQDMDLTIDKNDEESGMKCFDSDLIEYSNQETEESKQMTEVLKNFLEKCGFSLVGKDNHYVVSTEYMLKQSFKNKVLVEGTYSSWEHE